MGTTEQPQTVYYLPLHNTRENEWWFTTSQRQRIKVPACLLMAISHCRSRQEEAKTEIAMSRIAKALIPLRKLRHIYGVNFDLRLIYTGDDESMEVFAWRKGADTLLARRPFTSDKSSA
ncbi:hypothetical protein CEXT_537901 [Caerostris extrusa]|uniref:Uncharacterized protein n=1 Tax=Caerostris extrusa TaxID=172846 RepID=A0AAV4XKE5_CAEEX|nr:hypothetical protein CEXT_537901 [Caerostris extrusa]